VKRKLSALIISFLFLTSIIPLSVTSENINRTIYVDDDNTEGPWDGTIEFPYQTITKGKNSANDGDTVFVFSGFYREYLRVNKSISIKGENRNTTVIDGGGNGNVVLISASSAEVSEFTIQNCGTDVVDSGIKLWYAPISYNKIYNNNFLGCGLSYNYYTSNNKFHHNTIENNMVNGKPLIYLENKSNVSINGYAGQVVLVNCDNISVSNLNISNVHNGCILYYSNNCSIFQNQIEQTSHGIVLYFSDRNIISENILISNSGGIIFGASNYNIMMRNKIKFNNIGIYDNLSPFIVRNHNNQISNNIIENNNIGVNLVWGHQALIKYNSLFNNNKGISIGFYSDTNIITKNNFHLNKRNVILAQLFDSNETIVDGNYWNIPRLFPKSFYGLKIFDTGFLPWLYFDWNPAFFPNDISITI
jgi:parallel beta-helix repeat protein